MLSVMSQISTQKNNRPNNHALFKEPSVIAGVIKFPHKKHGYPQIMDIAQKWAKDPNFTFIMVRSVSPKDFGIQFVYKASEGDGPRLDMFMKKYVYPLKEVLYAWDVAESTDSEDIVKYECLDN